MPSLEDLPANPVPPEFIEQPSLVLNPAHPYYALNQKKSRFKILKGGRGSAKSWSVAEALIRRATTTPLRMMCGREFQSSIKDSVHQLLSDTIIRLGVRDWFTITDNEIRSKSGATFSFKGLHRSPDAIKSAEGVDILWIEEGQSISKDTWKKLTPTIRKPGSEIWVTMNPEHDEGVLEKFSGNPPTDAIVIHANYDQNPHFTRELESERLYALKLIEDADNDAERAQAQSDYDHIWLGHTKKISNEVILAGKYVIRTFEEDLWKQAERLLYGADWGFAQDPSTLIRSFIIEDGPHRDLYIEYEAYGIGIELKELDQLWRSIPEAGSWPIKADNSRPETISFMRGEGYPVSAAEKWKGSVEDGISYIKAFRKIIIHPRCVHTINEAKTYRYKVDRISGEVLPIIIDKNNHCWDGIRYSLDGYIQRKGDLSIWAKLAQ